jgi:hypothetical protein
VVIGAGAVVELGVALGGAGGAAVLVGAGAGVTTPESTIAGS